MNNAVTSGAFIIEPPTLLNLGISGDDNRNAAVAVQYRKTGATNWHEAQPLLRLGDEKVGGREIFRSTGRRACSRAAFLISKKIHPTSAAYRS